MKRRVYSPCGFSIALAAGRAYTNFHSVDMFLFILGSYLLGSIPFGYLAGRMKGVDLREHGSCNIGATNAMRVLGRPIGICVFLCDFLKGLVPVLAWRYVAMPALNEGSWAAWIGLVCVGMAAILGHTYTCFLHFRGGKGVATTAGVLFAISPLIGVISLGVWAIVLFATRYVSLASMVAALVMVGLGLYQFDFIGTGEGGEGLIRPEVCVIVFFVLVAFLVIFKHRSNIVRLMQGTESKAFSGKKS